MASKLKTDKLDKYKLQSFGMILVVILVQFITTQPLISEKLYLNYLFIGYTIYAFVIALLSCFALFKTSNDTVFVREMLKAGVKEPPHQMWKVFVIAYYAIVIGMLLKSHHWDTAASVWVFAAMMSTTMITRQERLLNKEEIAKFHQSIHTYYEEKVLKATEEDSDTTELVRNLTNELCEKFNLPAVMLNDEECKDQLNEFKDAVFGGYRINSDELLERLKAVILDRLKKNVANDHNGNSTGTV